MKERSTRLSAKDAAIRLAFAFGFLTSTGGCVLPTEKPTPGSNETQPVTNLPTGIPTNIEVTSVGEVTPMFNPTETQSAEVCNLTSQDQAEVLFKEGTEGKMSAPLVTMDGIKSVYGEELAAVIADELKVAIGAMADWLVSDQVYALAYPKFAEDLEDKYKSTAVITRTIDVKDGVIETVDKGFTSMEAWAFQKGGWGVFVRDGDGLIKAILPQGEKTLSSWLMQPQGTIDIYTLPGQALYGDLQTVKVAEGCSWNLVQTNQEGKVTAALNLDASVEDKDNIWFVDPKYAQELQEEAKAITEIEKNITVEGVTCISRERCWNDQINVNEEEGRKYYRYFLESLLKSGVNDDYFRNNFGINPYSSDAVDQLIGKLRERDYDMPGGLVLFKRLRDFESELDKKTEGFNIKTLYVSVLNKDLYIKNNNSEDGNLTNIPKEDWNSGEGVGMHYFALSFFENEGKRYLHQSTATALSPKDQYGNESIASVNIKDQKSLNRVNKYFEYVPYLIQNFKNAQVSEKSGYSCINNMAYFYGDKAGYTYKYSGSYNKNSSPIFQVFTPK